MRRLLLFKLKLRKITDDTISDKEICSKIITAAPKMYISVIGNLHKDRGSNLEIEDLEQEMCELYRMCNVNEEGDEESNRKDEGK